MMLSNRDIISLPVLNTSVDRELDHWREILERLGTTVWVWNMKTDGVEFTKNWLASLGYADDHVTTGAEWLEIVHPDDRQRVASEANLCIDGSVTNFEQEFRVRKNDGSYQWMMSRAQVFRRAEAKTDDDTFVVGIYTNTTRLRATRAALQTSELRWIGALEGSGVGVWDWNLETNDVYFSPEWINMLRYVDGDLKPTIESWRQVVVPEDLLASDNAIAKYLAGETDEYRCECRVRCKDGSIKWVLDRGKVSERAPDGKPSRMVGTHDDITEAKLHEEQITEAHTQLQLTTSQVPGVVDQGQRFPDGTARFPFSSDGIRDLFGLDSDEVADNSLPLWEKIHDDDREALTNALLAADETVQFRSVDYRIVAANGEIRWLRNDANPKQSLEKDGSRLWYGYIWDITDEKNRESELRSQRDRLGRITSLVPGALYEYIIHRDGSASIPFASGRIAEIFGASAEEIQNDPNKLWNNVAPQFLSSMENAIQLSIETGIDFDEEYQIISPTAKPRWVRTIATCKTNEVGDTVFLCLCNGYHNPQAS